MAHSRRSNRTWWEHILDGGSPFGDSAIATPSWQPPAPRLPQHVQAVKPRQRYSPKVLRDEDIQFFITYGYLKVSGCLTTLQCDMIMGNLWQRTGVSPDKSTWHSERIDVPSREEFGIRRFAPKAWHAMCDLLGGEDRIEEWCDTWDDSLIVNLGTPEGEGKIVPGQDLDGWHVDGDFFAHFLDSPEQALLMIPLFTDIESYGGGTTLCAPALTEVAQFLYTHPEGVSPNLVPRAEDPSWNRTPTRWRIDEIIQQMPHDSFIEASGKAGDVYFIHPLVPHSASNNARRDLRVINNPGASLKQPFNFDRADRNYSIVELTTLHHLRRDRLPGWRILGTRDRIDTERKRKEKLEQLNQTKPRYINGWYAPP